MQGALLASEGGSCLTAHSWRADPARRVHVEPQAGESALSGPKAGASCHALQMVKDYAVLGLAQEVLMRCVWVQTVDESQMYKQQMAGGMGNPMGPPDPKKAFEAEKSQLEMVRTHRSVHDTCPCAVCARL